MAKITSEKNIISIKAQAIELLKEQFQSYSGITYDTLDEFTNVDLTIDMSALNTTIEIAKAQTDVYKEDLRLLEEDTNELSTAGGISSDIGDNFTASADATYSFSNYSFSSGLKGTYDYSTKDFSPYVTVSATYTSDSNTISNSLEILAAENLVQQSNLDYQDALTDHSLSVFSLQNDIQESNLELQQFEIEKSVNTQSLANTQMLYDSGFATDTELTKAKNLCDLDTINEQIIKLDRLIIQNNIDKEFL
jgi:outer membrane protein TolC